MTPATPRTEAPVERRKVCLFCENAADSAEHTMPAVLGGLRKHNGLLCTPHNNGFSTLDSAVAKNLGFFNALLSVRNSRSRASPRVRVRTLDGSEFVIADGRTSVDGMRVFEDSVQDGYRRMRVAFGNEAQATNFKNKLIAEGKPVTFERFTVRPITPGQHWFDFSFGGDATLRGVARIALNFFADAFPVLARHDAMGSLKRWILDGGDADFVRFDFGGTSATGGQNAFPFGHRVIVGCGGAAGETFARVCFFDTIEVTVQFGKVAGVATRTIITDVDPLSGNASSGDIARTVLEDAVELPVFVGPKPDVSEALSERIHELMRRIRTHRWQQMEAELL